VRQCPRLPSEESAERQAREVDQPQPDAIGARREQADEGLDADMAAAGLHIGRGHEGRADQQKHRSLVLPVIGGVEQRTAEDAVAQDRAGGDQRERRQHDDDAVAGAKRAFANPDQRVAGRGVRSVVALRKWTMHHAAMSDASFSRLAAVAVLAP
jgi:hypothetical protein